jgi:hypothetical protein
MKRHPAWLAAGLLLFAVIACNLSKNTNSNNANRNTNDNKSANANQPNRTNADVYINRIYMAKDNNGRPGDETASFSATDRVVHCVAELNKAKKGTEVRYIWKMIDVEGAKDKEIRKTDYTTKSFESKVQGHLSLPYDWPKGKYGVDVYIDGELDKTIEYTIE